MRNGVPVENETTFCVRIYFCQNASWQGSIQWLEGRKTLFFRSMLEMSMLMFGALQNDDGVQVLPFPEKEIIKSNHRRSGCSEGG